MTINRKDRIKLLIYLLPLPKQKKHEIIDKFKSLYKNFLKNKFNIPEFEYQIDRADLLTISIAFLIINSVLREEQSDVKNLNLKTFFRIVATIFFKKKYQKKP